MQIESAESLIYVLRESGLFSPDQFREVVHDLISVGDEDPATLMRHLVDRNQITVYQLRKLLHGKASDLFFGEYVIVAKIGEGGMGKVYKARKPTEDKHVALKIVRSNLLSNPLVRKRYEREVQAASSLLHPNIVSVFDAGEVDGRYYMAMEFVDGIDLSKLVRDNGVLPVAEACEYARQAALGLQHAHDSGFVHRDIKPSNIVVSGERHVSYATEPAIVKILDMGLVRDVGLDDGGPSDLTRAGTVVGTPDYMAPEQAKNSSTVDHRADLYSLGCAMVFLLTGRPPFPDGTPIEKLLRHQSEAPVDLTQVREDVSKGLASLVKRLMAKKPDQRFQSARELVAVLEPFCIHGKSASTASLRARPSAAPHAPSEELSPTERSTPPHAARQSTPALTETPGPVSDTPRPGSVRPAASSPFEFPHEPTAEATKPGDVIRKRTPVQRSQRSMGLVLGIVAAVLLLAVVVWAVVKR